LIWREDSRAAIGIAAMVLAKAAMARKEVNFMVVVL
jgi:hypothetical protein